MTDIDERSPLRDESALRWNFLEDEADACIVVSGRMELVYVNGAAKTLIPDAWFGKRCFEVLPVVDETCAFHCPKIAAVNESPDVVYCEEAVELSEQSVSVDLSSLSGILAVYVDLPGVGVRPLGPLNPFVGGGLGATRVASGETRLTFPKTRTLVPGTRRTALTWRLTAGLGISWGERATLDLAWRYTDAGIIETGAGPGRVEWLDGSRDPVGLDLAPTQAPLRSHGLHLSLRYEL